MMGSWFLSGGTIKKIIDEDEFLVKNDYQNSLNIDGKVNRNKFDLTRG